MSWSGCFQSVLLSIAHGSWHKFTDPHVELLRFSAESCQYGHEDKSEETKRIFIAFAVSTKIVVPTRIALRLYTQGRLGWDDGLILAAFV